MLLFVVAVVGFGGGVCGWLVGWFSVLEEVLVLPLVRGWGGTGPCLIEL